MNDFCDGGYGAPIRFFHISTDGTNNGIVHSCDKDFRQANIISVRLADKYGLRILCVCHMSTHSHFVVSSETYEQAYQFSEAFKREYSFYAHHEHGIYGLYQKINSKPIEITDFDYLKNCIVYVLLNPVEAKIVSSPEQYKWSSFHAYWNNEVPKGIKAHTLTVRETKKYLKTNSKFVNKNLILDDETGFAWRTFIEYDFVESLFSGQVYFFNRLRYVNYSEQELVYVSHNVKYSDTELYAEALSISKWLFKVDNLNYLTKSQKIRALQAIHKKTKASPGRIARILRMRASEAKSFLGKSDQIQ